MDMHAEQSFAELLRRARRDAGLTQEELAARAGISTRAVSDLEREINRTPQLETLRLLADALDLSPADRRAWMMSRRRASSRAGARMPRGPDDARHPGADLPTPMTSFVGRDQDVAEVISLLGRQSVRLVTITGPGGVGKTRLAIAAARAVESPNGRFPDGVRFINFAPLRDPDQILAMIATTLGGTVTIQKPVLNALIATLRNSRQLLVLDNLEQVVTGAPALAELLLTCPGLALLATSRVPLRVQGEHEYAARPFALPDDTTVMNLDRLRRFAAIDLFQQRAQAIVSDFQITEQNAPAIAGICRRVDGLPLAVELVAARVRLFPPAALLARLERRLPLLTGAPRDAPARQQTLSDTIRWSYDLLEPMHQRLFRTLGVFQDGWNLDAAEAVIEDTSSDASVLAGLEALIAHNLVRMHEQEDGEPRYTMLETIAEFAREQLEATDETLGASERHAKHFLNVARHAKPHLTGADQSHWMALLKQDHANLRGAIQWLNMRAERGDAGAVVASFEIAESIWWFWHVQGFMREAQQYCTILLRLLSGNQEAIQAVTGPTEWSRMYARMLFLASGFSMWQSDYHRNSDWSMLKESLAIHRQLDQRSDIALTLMFLGYGAQRVGNFAEAERYLTEGLVISRDLGDDGCAALALQGLGMIDLRRGDYERGSGWMSESLAVFTSLGDDRGIAAARGTLGALLLRQHDIERANAFLRDSLTARHRVGDKGGIAWCLEWMAASALIGEPVPEGPLRAARLLGAAAALRTAIESPIDPIDVRDHERVVAAIQAQLSDPAFVAAWETGRSMTLDDIIAYALESERTDLD